MVRNIQPKAVPTALPTVENTLSRVCNALATFVAHCLNLPSRLACHHLAIDSRIPLKNSFMDLPEFLIVALVSSNGFIASPTIEINSATYQMISIITEISSVGKISISDLPMNLRASKPCPATLARIPANESHQSSIW